MYTVKKLKTNSSRGVRNFAERTKIRRLRRKKYRKKITKIVECHVTYW